MNQQGLVTSFWVTSSSLSNSVTRINPLNPHQPTEVGTSFYRLRIGSTENSCTENAFFQSQRHLWLQRPHITATPFSGGRILSGPSWGFLCHRMAASHFTIYKDGLMRRCLISQRPCFYGIGQAVLPWIGSRSNNQIFKVLGLGKTVRQVYEARTRINIWESWGQPEWWGRSHRGLNTSTQIYSLSPPFMFPTSLWLRWYRIHLQAKSLGWEDPLEKRKATHSSILAWRVPWTV